MWYLNSEMGSSEYAHDLRSIWWCYRANIFSQPVFHPVKERQNNYFWYCCDKFLYKYWIFLIPVDIIPTEQQWIIYNSLVFEARRNLWNMESFSVLHLTEFVENK